jgi:hypothetical protein
MLVHLRDHRVPDKNTIRSIDDFEIYVSFKEGSPRVSECTIR